MILYILLIVCLFIAVIALVVWVFKLKQSLKEHFILEQELQYEVGHDELTDLVSIAVAVDRLNQSIKNAKRYDNKIAALYLGVDYFKQINNSSGFDITNEFLQILATELNELIGDTDTVARVNENEFLIILEGFDDNAIIQEVLGEIMEISKQRFAVKHHKIKTKFSIGVSMFPNDKVDTMTLLNHAYSAMELVRRSGGNDYKFYTPELAKQAVENSKFEYELVESIKNDELEVSFYEESGEVKEIIRWKHHILGLLEYESFKEVAKEIGFDEDIEAFAIQKRSKYKAQA